MGGVTQFVRSWILRIERMRSPPDRRRVPLRGKASTEKELLNRASLSRLPLLTKTLMRNQPGFLDRPFLIATAFIVRMQRSHQSGLHGRSVQS